MKLIVILSVIAYGYAAKLDRTYLPPENAATAGGSPGSLATPFGSAGKPLEQPSGQFGFGQPSGPSGSGQSAAPSGFAPSPGSGLGSPAGPTKFNKPTESSGFPSGPANFGSPAGTVQPNQPSGSSSFGQRPIESTGFGQSPVTPQLDQSPNAFGLGPARQPTNNAGLPSGPSQFSQPSGSPTFRQQSSNVGVPSRKQAFGTPASQSGFSPSLDGSNDKTPVFGIGSQGAQGASGYAGNDNLQPERPQAAADRNAEILRYDNENDGENYAYSFETSNGIAAEESGVATNGVQAQGAFSYTGDDGQFYQVSYTADENGFVPQGDHLPTPPPIPDEILKSLEVNAKAAAAGTQEGAYRPEEDETDTPQSIGSVGTTSYNQPQGQDQPSNQYGTPGYNRPQSQGGSSGTPSYSRPQSQIPNRQYGAPSHTLQGQDQGGNQGGFDQSRNTVQSTGREYKAPVSTKAQSLVPQKPGSYNNAANGGYSYDQPQSQGQGSKPESSFSNAGSIPTGPQGSSNAGIQGQTTQYSGSPSYNQGNAPNNGYSSFQNKEQDFKPQLGPSGTNSIPAGSQGPINNGIQGQTSQHIGSPSKNRGNAPNGGYNYNQPQNQEQSLRPQFGQSSTGSIPTRQQGSSNGIKGQTSNFGGSPSYSQGNAPNGGYNYNQAENRGQGPKPQFGSPSTGLISTGSQESSNAVTQEQPQFSGSPSYIQDSNAQNTGFNYNQPEFSGKGPKLQGIPNANDQGKINQQGQGRGLGYQTTSPGNNNVAFPNQSKGTVTTESQVQGGYQYNRPSSGGLSQLGTNEGKINQRPAFAPQGSKTTGTQEFNKPFSNGASQKGSRPQPFGPITSSQGPQGPSQSAFDSNGQDSTGPISATNQNQFGVTVTSQKGSQPQSFNSIPSGQGAQGTSRPSFGQVSTGIANQNQFGSPASSAPRPFMPQSAPYQYKQPSGQGSQFPQQTQTGTKQDSSTFDGDRSEFGGPRQPPSFSPEEGYKY